ncbi:unnamed protein product [Closterium sp. NIES-54]
MRGVHGHEGDASGVHAPSGMVGRAGMDSRAPTMRQEQGGDGSARSTVKCTFLCYVGVLLGYSNAMLLLSCVLRRSFVSVPPPRPLFYFRPVLHFTPLSARLCMPPSCPYLPLPCRCPSPLASPPAHLYFPVTISHPGHINHTTNVTVLAGRPTLLHLLLRPSSPPSLHAPSIFQTRSLSPPPPQPSGLAWLPWHWGSKRGGATKKQGVTKGGGQGGRAGGADDPSLVLPSRQQAAAAAAAGGVLSSDEVMWAVGMGSSAALAAAVVAVVLLGGLLMMVGHRRRRFLFSHRGLPLRSLPK